jgi:hypothetical protein
MRCGVPIIAGNRTSIPEVVGDAGILVNPFSTEEITDALVKVAQNEDLRNELAEKSLERSNQFSWDVSAEKIWEVLRKSM